MVSSIPQLFTTAFLIQIVNLGLRALECRETLDMSNGTALIVPRSASWDGVDYCEGLPVEGLSGRCYCTVHTDGSLIFPMLVRAACPWPCHALLRFPAQVNLGWFGTRCHTCLPRAHDIVLLT